MTKSQKEYLIVGLLVLVFFAVLSNSLHKTAQKRRAQKPTFSPSHLDRKEGPASLSSVPSEWASWGRDPFVGGFLSSGEEDPLGLVLSGITYDATNPMCVINGEILTKGDKIEGCEVLEITEKSVTVRKEARDYQLKLFSE